MTDDTLTRARAALARLAEVEREATPGPWAASHRHVDRTADDDEDCGLGLEVYGPPPASGRGQFERGADARVIAVGRNALPALLALAEATARLEEKNWWVEGKMVWYCVLCRSEDFDHRPDCPAVAIDAALAALADATGEVQP